MEFLVASLVARSAVPNCLVARGLWVNLVSVLPCTAVGTASASEWFLWVVLMLVRVVVVHFGMVTCLDLRLYGPLLTPSLTVRGPRVRSGP